MKATAKTIMRRWLKLAEGGEIPEQMLNPKWGCPIDFAEDVAPGEGDDLTAVSTDLKTFREQMDMLTIADVVLDFNGFVDYIQTLASNFEDVIAHHNEQIAAYEAAPDYAASYHDRVVVQQLDTPEEWFEDFKHEVKQ